MNEDLLQPSLTDEKQYRQLPWSNNAQLLVAFFGGALALTIFAYMNGKRLLLSTRELLDIVAVGTLGTVASLLAYAYLAAPTVTDAPLVARGDQSMLTRFAPRIIAMVTYLIIIYFQRRGLRMYKFSTDGEYDSPWKVGLILIFVVGTLQNIVAAWLPTVLF